jgi:two-component system chemotaxis response regulator CheY
MRKKAIVVDDSLIARRQVVNILSGAGFEVIEAVDGLEGASKLSAHPDANIVVCDLNMPRMNGLELLAQATSSGVRSPFIMLTTEAQPQFVRQAKQNGAKAWVTKPVKPDLLLAAVNKFAVP